VDVQPCDCQPDGRATPVLELAAADVKEEAVALVDSKSRRSHEPPHACVPSPGQATAWQAESGADEPTFPEALSFEPQ
jgi:hypothetical protein